ncbi:DNA-directed RNA polymerase subunit delta [Alkalibacillus haloalkaliphilus]|uniref:DNA-directed RNA polymerase subunit delta n=1 Tax=Alkalibacillus haloalkaliphilus TaxID=94136 RepID=UPI002936B4E3|nr:DNA-directed RNA polymerase subunit delta [Alkalibacillus haloalkaliphilus]MDV2583124.1 DNA-directed RNA polymerase subunit delta [Alkalibacillus haloalkaliphilus]
MSLTKYSKEEVKELSMIDIAYEIMLEENQAKNFQDIFKLVAEARGFSEEEKQQFISQFYTDLNIDGRFLSVGSNLWGLKHWYPFDQTVEDAFVAEEKPKKKKKKKKAKEEPVAEEEVLLEDDLAVEDEAESEEVIEDEVDDLEKDLDKGDEDEDL